ncbi:hypothetical protein Tco_0547739 [Tanacetum coccineum]
MVLRNRRIHKDGDGDALFQLNSDSLPHAHAQTTKTYYKHRDSRIMKAQELKTKTSAQTLIYKIFLQRYQVYQGRLLASFQDDAKDTASDYTVRKYFKEAGFLPEVVFEVGEKFVLLLIAPIAKSLASHMSSNGRFQFGHTITGAHKASNTFDISGGGNLDITSIFALSTSRPALDTLKKIGFFQEYIFHVIRKRFEFKIHRRFFEICFDLVIGVKIDFLNGGSLVLDSNSEFSSVVIAMNSSNSAKIFSSRMVPSMEWRISLPSSIKVSKSSSKILSMTSILKHVSSFE